MTLSTRNVPEGLGLGLAGGLGTQWDTCTYPTDSARALVDSSDTKTWQANRWSAGCLVINPKYLWEDSSLSVGGMGARTPLGTSVAPHPAIMAADSQPTPQPIPPHLLVVLRMVSTERDVF